MLENIISIAAGIVLAGIILTLMHAGAVFLAAWIEVRKEQRWRMRR